jgi:hypothetical protein
VLHLKCVVAGLVALILVFGGIFVAVLFAVMTGFVSGLGFEKPERYFGSPVFWLVALAIFGAGFLWELRRLSN